MQNASSKPRRLPFLVKLLIVFVLVAVVFGIAGALEQREMRQNAHRRVAVARLGGVIEDVGQLGGWLDSLRDDPYVKAVLLRVDSPGGGVAASQELYEKVRRLAERKTVVASMGDMAASGGYYVSLGADAIVANPSTITGSIGVIMVLPNLMELMEKIGVRQESVTSGELKDAGSPFKELTPRERAYFKDIIDDLYEQFIEDIATARDMDLESVRKLADGRVYTGRQALGLGLVDVLGTFDDALDLLCDMEGIDAPLLLEQPEPDAPLMDRVLDRITGSARLPLPAGMGNVLNTGSYSPVFLYLY